MQSMQIDRSGHCWSWAARITLALAASAALADAPKAASPGIMTFPNVTVVNAPVAAPAKTTASAQGVRAYVDQGTRQLREQTREEALEAAIDTKAKPQLRSQSRSRALSVETAAAEPEVIYGPENTIGVVLTDEFLVYQVVRKSDEGLEKVEVTGRTAADATVKSKSPTELNAVEVGHAQ